MRSRSRNTSRSKAGSTSGAGARAARGSEPARRWRRHDGHSRSRPANSGRTSYTSPHGQATTMPTGRLTAPSRQASQTPDVSRRDQPSDGQESDAGQERGNPVEDAGGQLRHTMSTSELMPRLAKVIRFPRRPATPSHERGFVEVRRCDQAEAVVVRSLFESEGIPTLLQSRLAHSVYPFSVGDQGAVVILVPVAEAPRGRRLLTRLVSRRSSA